MPWQLPQTGLPQGSHLHPDRPPSAKAAAKAHSLQSVADAFAPVVRRPRRVVTLRALPLASVGMLSEMAAAAAAHRLALLRPPHPSGSSGRLSRGGAQRRSREVPGRGLSEGGVVPRGRKGYGGHVLQHLKAVHGHLAVGAALPHHHRGVPEVQEKAMPKPVLLPCRVPVAVPKERTNSYEIPVQQQDTCSRMGFLCCVREG